MNQSLSSLNFILKADISQFKKAMNEAEKGLVNTGKAMKTAGAGLSSAITVPMAAATTAMFLLTNRSAEFADNIDEMSQRTGVAKSTLQELSYVAGQVGIDFPSLEKSMAKLNKSMGDAAGGGEKQMQAFAQLGVSVTDSEGRLRSMSDIFPEVVGKLGEMTNESERNYLSMLLFGRGANEVITPLTELGESGMKNMIDRARELGVVMSDEGITSLANYNDAMQSMKDQASAAGRELSVGFAKIMTDTILPLLQDKIIPAITALAKWFSNLPSGIKTTVVTLAGLLAVAGPLLLIFGKFISVIPTIIAAAKAMSTAMTVLNAVMAANPIGLVVIAIAALVAGIIWAWNKFEGFRMFLMGLWESFKAVFTNIKELAKNVLGGIGELLYGVFTFDMDKIKEGIGRLKAGFTEYGQKIAEAYQTGAEKGKDMAVAMDEVATSVDKVTVSTKAAVPEVQTLEDQLSSLEDLLWKQVQADDAGAAATARKVRLLQNEIKYLKEKQDLLVSGKQERMKSITKVQVDTSLTGPVDSDIMLPRKAVSSFTGELKNLAQVSIDVSSSVQNAIGQMASQFGQTLGEMATGTASVSDLFTGILDMVGKFMTQLGEALIASAVAAIAFKKLLLNPWVALAAGVALIALGSVVSNLLAAGPGGKGGGGGGRTSGEGGNQSFEGPRMANGGIVTRPTILMAGEGGQNEAIIPINTLMNTIHNAISGGGYMSRMQAGMRDIKVQVEVTGKLKSGEMYLMNKNYNAKLAALK